jgi:signal transduction histidine kinase
MLRLGKLKPTGDETKDSKSREAIKDLTSAVIQELRALSAGLVLPEISDLTVAETIRLAAERHENVSGTKVELILGDLSDSITVALKICLYRIVQESLTNSFKHAGGIGQRVEARMAGRTIVLTISDRGGGFSPDQSFENGGLRLGLRGIRNRVLAFGGAANIRSDGAGTIVDVEVPLSELAGGFVRSPPAFG